MSISTGESLVRAAMNLAEQAERRRLKPSSRYRYEPAGQLICFRKPATVAMRAERDERARAVLTAGTPEARAEALANLRKLPVRFVQVKSAILVDRSRYTGEKLRAIRRAQSAPLGVALAEAA